VRRVHRRTTLALALLLATAAVGCSSVSDSNAVARVNGTELSQDDLNTKLEELGATSGEVLPLEPIRAEIGRWIKSELAKDLDIAGTYDAGPAESGVTCIRASVVADEAAAAAALADLEGGTEFGEMFSATNLDQGLVATDGALPCISAADLEANAGTPFISVATTLSADAPFGIAPVLDESGSEAAWVVIAFRPFTDLEQADIDEITGQVDVSTTAAGADIFVASRYGTFDAATGEVVGLG
jgi:hypothetical protein